MKKILILLFVIISVSLASAQPPPPGAVVSKADYANCEPIEIPPYEALWLEDLPNPAISFDDFLIENQNSYCNTVFDGYDICHITGNTCTWGPWEFGVYTVRSQQYDCKIRVEYQWRNCVCDYNITQHKILAVFFEIPEDPAYNTLCAQLKNWIYNGGTNPNEDRLHYLFEDMYLKIGIEAFKDNNAFVKSMTGHDIYCGDPNGNLPTKVYHVTASCKAYCYSTYHDAQGKVQTMITEKNCYADNCCTVLNSFCKDPITGKLIIENEFINRGVTIECGLMQTPPTVCHFETSYVTGCTYKCGDEYLIKGYGGTVWADYPFRDTYSDILDPNFMNFTYTLPKISAEFLENSLDDANITLNPNPVRNKLNIEINSAVGNMESIAIYDVNGNLVKEIGNHKNFNFVLDVNEFSNGTYFLLLSSAEKKFVKRFVVSK